MCQFHVVTRPRRRLVSRSRLLDVAYPAVTVALLLGAWEVGVRAGHEPRYIMVPFSDVAQASYHHFGILMHHTWVTLREALYGWALGIAVAIPLAFLIATVPLVSKTIYPLVVVYHVIPAIALGPMLYIWFGFGILPKLLIVANFTFFPIMLNAVIGLRSTQPTQVHLFRSAGAGTLETFVRLRLRNAMPQLFVGMKIASTTALIGAVVAEYISAREGLGLYILTANASLDPRDVTVGIVYLAVTGALLFGAVQVIEKVALPWHVSQRAH
jgi:NitT/TauT family transport system permease protein